MSELKKLRAQVKDQLDHAGLEQLRFIKAVLEKEDGDSAFWAALPEDVKTEIEETLAELDAGKGIPHEEIVKKYPRLCLK